ncbi:MAG: hypothetical protein WEC79_06435 [Thermomicrobiales bacterium]
MTDRRTRQPDGSIEATQALALRLAIGAALLTFGLSLYARSLDLLRTDIPLRASNGRLFWLASVIGVIGFGFAVDHFTGRIASTGSVVTPRPDLAASSAAILPALVVFAALQLVAWDSRFAVALSASLLAGAGVFTAIVVRHYLLSGDPAVFSGARLVQMSLTAAVGFLSLSLARGWMAGTLYTLVVVMVIAGLLLFQAFDGVRAFPIRRAAYALAAGVVLAEVAVALSYWPPLGWHGGAIVATVFVVLMLTIDAILTRSVSSDLVARYAGAGVGVCGLLVFLAR